MNLRVARIYLRVWLRLTRLQFQTQVANSRVAALVFLSGKILRTLVHFIFIYVVIGKAQSLAGFSLSEAIFILALFVWGGTLTQLVFRAVYQFREKIQSGSFDFYLLTPLNPLFLSLFSVTDPMDLFLMLPYTYLVFWTWSLTSFPITILGLVIIVLATLLILAFNFALHTFVISLGVRYLEVDNLIMLYRDVERMGTYPIDIYGKYLGGLLTYFVPIAIFATIPAKIIFGLASPAILLIFALLALVQIKLALLYWNRALKHYTSASS
jgi:ABC-2 type transport system permease protein